MWRIVGYLVVEFIEYLILKGRGGRGGDHY